MAVRVLFQLLDAGVGGGQRVAVEAAIRLRERGDEVGLVVPADGPTADEFRRLGAEVALLDAGSLRRPGGAVRLARALRAYDLLYSHTSAPGQLLGRLAALLARRPHVVHQHTSPYFSTRPLVRRTQVALYRALLRRARFVAVADHVADGLVALGVDRACITVIPNGTRLAPEPPSEPAREPASRPLRIGMLGRIDPGKGIQTFVAAARATELGERVEFVVYGTTGPFADFDRELRAAAAGSGIAIVEPAGGGSAALAALDIVAIPSRYEGSPLVLFEAMALGRAIVASDIPGIREVIGPRRAGLLVPVDDADALARALATLAGDPTLRAELGRNARDAVAAGYGLERCLDRIEAVLDEAVAAARR